MKKSKFLFLLTPSFVVAQGFLNNEYNILQTPKARVSDDFKGSVYLKKNKDYLNTGINLSVLPKLQTEIIYQNVSDDEKRKFLNLKLLLNKENEYLPSVVYSHIGIWPNNEFSSKYIAISKNIGYFDFTLGYSTGFLANKENNSFKDGTLFFNTEFYAHKNFSLYFERDFLKDLNVGLEYKINDKLSSSVSFLRGDSLGFSLKYNFSLFSKTSSKYNKLKKIEEKATFKNSDYFTYVIDENKISEKKVTINKIELNKYKDEMVSYTYMQEALDISKDVNIKNKADNKFYYELNPVSKLYYDSNKNTIESKNSILLNSHFYFYDFNLNSSLLLDYQNNIKNSFYEKDKKEVNLDSLYISYNKNLALNTYLQFDVGALNYNYNGLNIELSKLFFEEKIGLSLQYQKVEKENEIFDAKFFNAYYQLSSLKNTHLGLKYGKFFYKDKGIRIDFARTYKNYILGAYYSNTSFDSSENNKGFYIKIPFDYKKISNKKRAKNISFETKPSTQAQFVDLNTALFNSLSNEDNLQIIKKRVFDLK